MLAKFVLKLQINDGSANGIRTRKGGLHNYEFIPIVGTKVLLVTLHGVGSIRRKEEEEIPANLQHVFLRF